MGKRKKKLKRSGKNGPVTVVYRKETKAPVKNHTDASLQDLHRWAPLRAKGFKLMNSMEDVEIPDRQLVEIKAVLVGNKLIFRRWDDKGAYSELVWDGSIIEDKDMQEINGAAAKLLVEGR